MLNTFATEIINECNSISSVDFGVWQSSLIGIYGLMPDGDVKLFKCSEGHFHGGGFRDLVWGELCSV